MIRDNWDWMADRAMRECPGSWNGVLKRGLVFLALNIGSGHILWGIISHHERYWCSLGALVFEFLASREEWSAFRAFWSFFWLQAWMRTCVHFLFYMGYIPLGFLSRTCTLKKC